MKKIKKRIPAEEADFGGPVVEIISTDSLGTVASRGLNALRQARENAFAVLEALDGTTHSVEPGPEPSTLATTLSDLENLACTLANETAAIRQVIGWR